MEDVLDPDLATRALGQVLDSPEPHDLYEIVSCKLADAAVLNSSSPLSVCNLPMPSLSPMGDDCGFLNDWLDRRSDSEAELDSDGPEEPGPSPEPAGKPVTDTPAEHTLGEDASEESAKERLRQRQREYEKKYRNRKKVELKLLRKQWLALEASLLVERRAKVTESVVVVHQRMMEAIKAREPARGREELVNRCRVLARLKRALLMDRMAMSALIGFGNVALIREYTEKEALLTRREWKHSTSKIFGCYADMAPHSSRPLTFTW